MLHSLFPGCGVVSCPIFIPTQRDGLKPLELGRTKPFLHSAVSLRFLFGDRLTHPCVKRDVYGFFFFNVPEIKRFKC